MIPPAIETRPLFPGMSRKEPPGWRPRATILGEREKIIEVHLAQSVINTMELLAGLVKGNGIDGYRHLQVCGRVITREPPVYLEEKAAVFALKLFTGYQMLNDKTS